MERKIKNKKAKNKKAKSANNSSVLNQPVTNSNENYENDENEGSAKSKNGFFKKWINTMLMTAFTGLVAYSTFQQTCISENIRKIADSTLRVAHRPYLVIDKPRLQPFLSSGSLFKAGEKSLAVYTIKNRGQTPAYQVREMKFLQVLPPNSCLIFPEDTTLLSNPFIIGSEIRRTKFSKDTLSQSQIIEFSRTNSQARIFFWGRIKYQDSFKKVYFTNFGYEYMFLYGIFYPYKDYNSAN